MGFNDVKNVLIQIKELLGNPVKISGETHKRIELRHILDANVSVLPTWRTNRKLFSGYAGQISRPPFFTKRKVWGLFGSVEGLIANWGPLLFCQCESYQSINILQHKRLLISAWASSENEPRARARFLLAQFDLAVHTRLEKNHMIWFCTRYSRIFAASTQETPYLW